MAASSRATGKDPKGLYSTLGVGVDSDEAEIRKAYRKLALRWHPDKNPGDDTATQQFQKISSAYEVLSDSKKREMYDATGCIDEEEFAEGGADLSAEIFARFFGGGLFEDLDDEEQGFMDELLRMSGSNPFKTGRRRRGKKGRGGGFASQGLGGAGRKGKAAGGGEDELMQAFMMAMGSSAMGMDMEAEPVCPKDHALKKRKADAEYACDVCEKDIMNGKRFYDCRKCDWCICLKCYKEAKEAATEKIHDDDEDLEEAELLQAFCEMHVKTVRKGKTLQHQCELCKACFATADEVLPHMEERHHKVIEEFVAEAVSMPPSGLLGGDPMMEMLLGGMMGMPGMEMPGEGYPTMSSGGGKKSGRKKR